MPKGPLRISVGCHGHTQAHPEGTPELPHFAKGGCPAPTAGHPPVAKWGAPPPSPAGKPTPLGGPWVGRVVVKRPPHVPRSRVGWGG